MPQPLYPPARPQTIAEVLDSVFRIFKVSLVQCLLYAAVGMIAGQLPNIYYIAAGIPLKAFGGGDPLWIALYAVGAIIMLLMFAALMLRQKGIATGQRLSTRVELSEAARRLPAYLGTTLLWLLAICAFGLVFGFVVAVTGLTPTNPKVIGIGVVVLGLPVMYMFTPLTLATPAVLLDGKGPLQAFRYCLHLVRGAWWRATTALTLGFIVLIVLDVVVGFIIGLLLSAAGASDVAAVMAAATAVVGVVLGAVALPFVSALILAIYGDLQLRKEGLDLERRLAGEAQV